MNIFVDKSSNLPINEPHKQRLKINHNSLITFKNRLYTTFLLALPRVSLPSFTRVVTRHYSFKMIQEGCR